MEQSKDMKKKKIEEEEHRCCMCGDVGFSDQLLPCPVCRTRSQHTYCSSMYPKIEMGRWQCEWCLHKVRHIQRHDPTMVITATKLKKRQRDEDDKERALSSAIKNSFHNTKKQKLMQKPSCINNNNSSSPRSLNGRRYKLLADVLC